MTILQKTILTTLLKHRGEELSMRAVAGLIKKDYKNTYTALKQLEAQGVITITEFGGARKVSLQDKLHPLLVEAELARRADLLKNKNFVIIRNYCLSLKSKLFVLLLFGSYAKGTQTKHSDIDLFFIIPSKDLENDISKMLQLIPLNIHHNIFTEKEFKEMRLSKQKTVGSEIIKNNIILHNVEGYYALLNEEATGEINV